MEQRHNPRLARPYVLDGPDDHTAPPTQPSIWLPVTRTDNGLPVPPAAAAAPTVALDVPPDVPQDDVPDEAHFPPATPRPHAHPVTPHHLWIRRHQAAGPQPGTRGTATRALTGLLGAHGMTATFVVIVVAVAATVLAVAALKGRPETTSAGSDRMPGRLTGPTLDTSDDDPGPPQVSGFPAIPGVPGDVLPDGPLGPVGNAAGVPVGGGTPGTPGPAVPGAVPGAAGPVAGPGAPGAGQATAPGAGQGPVPGAGSGATTPVTPPKPTPTSTPGRPSTSPSPKEPEKGNAFRTIQGESFDGQSGVKIENAESGGGRHAGFISTGDWIRYDAVAFTGATARNLVVRASNGARENRSGRVELRLDRRSNAPVGGMTIPNNGLDKWFAFSTYSMSIPPTTGVHTVYLTFTSNQNEEFANVDWLTFTP